MSSYFQIPEKIHLNIIVDKEHIIKRVVSMLNKTAESRFDGQNTQYVNNLQPEVDFTQDQELVTEMYEEGIAKIARRIEPYVEGYGVEQKPVTDYDFNDDFSDDFLIGSTTVGQFVIHLAMPHNWKRPFNSLVGRRFEEYLVHFIISQWMERVSPADVEFYTAKSQQLLRDIKGMCELRQGKVHRGWNTTY
jgi:hypothetical protein